MEAFQAHPGFPANELEARRAAVFERLGEAVLVLPAAPPSVRSRDTEYRYRPDSELYYLSGCKEPGAVAVLLGGPRPRFELFVRDRDEDAELWTGPRLGPDEAASRFAADACHASSQLAERLPALLGRGDRIFYRERHGDGVGGLVRDALAAARRRGARQGTGPRGLVDPGEILDELRLRKSPSEIQRLRAAATLTVEGHRAGAAAIVPDAGEWEVQAAIEGAFRRARGEPGYPTIVGSGENACVLHYVENGAHMRAGDLVLVDAGAELDLYNGDITRTYPVSGRFSEEQRAIYEIVDSARSAAIEATHPGATIEDVHASATAVIVEGLVGLGILDGEVDALVEQEAHKPFFPHQASHWLGLDVHDPGDYAKEGAARVLEPGMVFTVEPGLYFRPAAVQGSGEAFSGIGIRIEDDVLVTEDGAEVLTAALPTAVQDVEAMVASK